MDVKNSKTTSAFRFPIKHEINMYKQINKNFDEKEFLEGAKVAYEVVSDLLFQHNLEPLEDMLTEECFESVSKYFEEIEKKNQHLSGRLSSIDDVKISSISVREINGKLETYVVVKVNQKKKLQKNFFLTQLLKV